jgi:hypothetical protein
MYILYRGVWKKFGVEKVTLMPYPHESVDASQLRKTLQP